MTSVATVFGHLPLTLVTGPGAAARNSIGLVLVAGMTIGTAFTLFLVPAIYLFIAREHRRDVGAGASDGSRAPDDAAAWSDLGEPGAPEVNSELGIPEGRPPRPASLPSRTNGV
jgi:hypothetical protein